MPTENTSRRPTMAKALGQKASWAISRQSRGKSTKLVLAESDNTASRLQIAT